MKKKFLSIIAFALTLVMQLTTLTPLVKAADLTNAAAFQFITGVTVTDCSGNPLPTHNVPKDQSIRIRYDFSIPDTQAVKAGDTYVITLPSQLAVTDTLAAATIPLKDTSGSMVANAKVDKTTGKVTFTFTDYASSHSNVSGHFTIESFFQYTTAPGSQNVVFSIGNSQQVTVDINFQQDVQASLSKSGSYNRDDNTITWVVKVNENHAWLSNAVLTDAIKAGQSYKTGSLNVTAKDYFNNGVTLSLGIGSVSGGNLTCNLGSNDYSYVVTFTTTVTDQDVLSGGQKTETNQAVLNNGGIKITADASTAAQALFTKTGVYNAQTKSIDWTITVNPDGKPLTNAVITDTLPGGLALNGVTANGTALTESDTQAGSGFYKYDTKTRAFTYAPGSISAPCVLVLSTAPTKSGYFYNNQDTNYGNQAKLTATDGFNTFTYTTPGRTVTIPGIISKNGTYNTATHKISWVITVNPNLLNIDQGASVVDQLPAGLTIDDTSIKMTGTALGSAAYQITGDAASGIKISFSNLPAFSDKETITFDTLVEDKAYQCNTSETPYSYKNNLSLTGKSQTNNIKVSITKNVSVNSSVISKSGYLGYDMTSKAWVAHWTVNINPYNFTLPNTSVVDAIPAGQQYMSGSFKIVDKTTNKSVTGDTTLGSFTAPDSSNPLSYVFNNAVNDTYTITYNTKITDLSVFNQSADPKVTTATFSNTAELHVGSIVSHAKATVSTSRASIDSSVIQKSGTYQRGSNSIAWSMDINTADLPLTSASITDTIPAGLAPDLSTVALYRMTVKSGKWQPDVLPVAAKKISYDQVANKLTVDLPDASDASAVTPYRLQFSTGITPYFDKTKTSVTNTVSLTGTGVTNSSSSTITGILVSNAWGGAEGFTGGIIVTKADKNDNTVKLSGAQFELLYPNQALAAGPVTTDINGSAAFTGLRYGTYYIKEVQAPAGYELDSALYPCTIDSSSINTPYSFPDTKMLGSIQVTKTDGNGALLSGAEFTLYDASGKAVTTALSGPDGIAAFGKLPLGSYMVRETAAPAGYELNSTVLQAPVTADNYQVPQTFTVSDLRMLGTIQITKTDGQGALLAGAQFTLYDASGKAIKTAASGTDGIAAFVSIPLGSYTVKETAAPSGYALNTSSLQVSVTADNYKNTLKFSVSDDKLTQIPDNDTPKSDGPTAPQNSTPTGGTTAQIPDNQVPAAANPKTGAESSMLPFLSVLLGLCSVSIVRIIRKKRKA